MSSDLFYIFACARRQIGLQPPARAISEPNIIFSGLLNAHQLFDKHFICAKQHKGLAAWAKFH